MTSMTTRTHAPAGWPSHRHESHIPDRVGLFFAGGLAVAGSVWVGVWPWVGSLLGHVTRSAPSWHWDAAHAVLAFVPGVIAALFGCLVIAEATKSPPTRGRAGLACTGVVLMACGVWFVVGTVAWPRITGTGGPSALGSSTLRLSDHWFGHNLVAGLLLVACGSFVAGWANRHQRQVHRPTGRTASAEEGLMVVKPIVEDG